MQGEYRGPSSSPGDVKVLTGSSGHPLSLLVSDGQTVSDPPIPSISVDKSDPVSIAFKKSSVSSSQVG